MGLVAFLPVPHSTTAQGAGTCAGWGVGTSYSRFPGGFHLVSKCIDWRFLIN
jgi:hypothetical protein